MTDDELKALVAQNSQDIAGTRQNLNALIEDVIKPMVERTAIFESRMDEIAQRAAENSERAAENSERAAENSQHSSENAILFRNLLAEAREDRINNQKRFDAQQEVIRALLLRVTSLNEDTANES